MKKIHRTLSLFTVAAMCTALLCSCGEVPDSSQTDSSSKAATTTTADTTADTTTTGEAALTEEDHTDARITAAIRTEAQEEAHAT